MGCDKLQFYVQYRDDIFSEIHILLFFIRNRHRENREITNSTNNQRFADYDFACVCIINCNFSLCSKISYKNICNDVLFFINMHLYVFSFYVILVKTLSLGKYVYNLHVFSISGPRKANAVAEKAH